MLSRTVRLLKQSDDYLRPTKYNGNPHVYRTPVEIGAEENRLIGDVSEHEPAAREDV